MQTFSLNNQLGELLKELRSKKGWSLRKAGEESGVSYSYISMLEKGMYSQSGKHPKVSPEQLKKLADAYGYSFNMIMIKAGYTESDLDTHENEEVSNVSVNDLSFYSNYSDIVSYNNYMDDLADESYYESLEHIILKEKVTEWKVASNIKTESIGDRLKTLRKKYDLTINDLSEQLVIRTEKTGFISYKKYPPSMLIEIETDQTEPTSSFLIAVSNFYKVSFDFLLTGYEKIDDLDLEEDESLEWDDRTQSNSDKKLPCLEEEVNNILMKSSNKYIKNDAHLNDFFKVNYKKNYEFSKSDYESKKSKEYEELLSKIDNLTKIVITLTSTEKTQISLLSPNIINAYQNKNAEHRD